MQKENMDKLYHLLRLTSNYENQELNDAISGLSQHLFCGGDYLALLKYLKYYGEHYILPKVAMPIRDSKISYNRVVDIGAGLGWFGRGIAGLSGILPVLLVDKRPWSMTDIVANLETIQGREDLKNGLRKKDVIVMSEFLHCIENPSELLEMLSPYPKIILEYMSPIKDMNSSYIDQISRYGCDPITPEFFKDHFGNNIISVTDMNPYTLVIVRGNKQQGKD